MTHLELSRPPAPMILEGLPGTVRGAEALRALGEAGGGEGINSGR